MEFGLKHPLEEQGYTVQKLARFKNGHPSIAYQFSEDHSDSKVLSIHILKQQVGFKCSYQLTSFSIRY